MPFKDARVSKQLTHVQIVGGVLGIRLFCHFSHEYAEVVMSTLCATVLVSRVGGVVMHLAQPRFP